MPPRHENLRRTTCSFLGHPAIHCPDNKGIVATVSEFIYKNNGNITFLDQHVDALRQVFFMRTSELENFIIPDDKIDEYFATLIAQKNTT